MPLSLAAPRGSLVIHGRLRCDDEAHAAELAQFLFKGFDETFPLGTIRARRHMAEFEDRLSRFEQHTDDSVRV